MATSKEIDAFVNAIMQAKGLDKQDATYFALGYVTSFVPSTEITKAINYMKDNR